MYAFRYAAKRLVNVCWNWGRKRKFKEIVKMVEYN